MYRGDLDTRVELGKPLRTADAYGSEAVRYEWRPIWAAIIRDEGRRVIEAGEAFADYAVSFRIDWRHKVGEHWRVRYRRGDDVMLFSVCNVLPGRRGGYIILKCDRVNE